MAQALQQIAMVKIVSGRPDDAMSGLAEATRLLRRANYQTGATYCLDGVAAVALAHGDTETAARALAVAETVRARLGTPVWPTVRAFVNGLLDAARDGLGAHRFDAVMADALDPDVFHALDTAVATVEMARGSAASRTTS